MLEHQKLVVKNVAYDLNLFRKELIKSLTCLNAYELTQFRRWLRKNFKGEHLRIIREILYFETQKEKT